MNVGRLANRRRGRGTLRCGVPHLPVRRGRRRLFARHDGVRAYQTEGLGYAGRKLGALIVIRASVHLVQKVLSLLGRLRAGQLGAREVRVHTKDVGRIDVVTEVFVVRKKDGDVLRLLQTTPTKREAGGHGEGCSAARHRRNTQTVDMA